MAASESNVMMVSADRWVVAGERGPFYYMLESFSRHWGRVDVIGTRPERIEQTRVFGNVHLHHPTSGKLRQAAFIARTGLALAAQRPYAVITSHDYNPFYNGLGSWRISRATGIPYVAEIHHVPGFPRAANLRERLDRRATRLYVRWARRRAAGFRVVNGIELPRLLRSWGVPGEQVHVLPSLYLDEAIFRPGPGPRQPDCDVLFVGRLVANKGLPELLGALGILAREGLPLRLKVVGRGPLQSRLEALSRRHGLADRLEHVPWVAAAEDLAAIYRGARVLCCASLSEGGPRVVPEAMACGTPVVSTPVGLVPDLVRDGVTGLLSEGSAEALARALGRFFREAGLEQRLQAALPPPELELYRREAVIAGLADGLKAIAAAARQGR